MESDAKSGNAEENDLEEEETGENVVSETESQKQRNEDEDERHPAYIPRKVKLVTLSEVKISNPKCFY